MKIDIKPLVRRNILELTPYSSARGVFSGNAGNATVYLDANENAYGSPLSKKYNRYPDPMQTELKETLAKIKNVTPENICIGNGSDELIDYLVRVFCEPKRDNIIITPPTFKMYDFLATINEIKIRKVLLTEDFQIDVHQVLKQVDRRTKIIFLCSPNNPTGNNLEHNDMVKLLKNFNGIVVVDEAYINFSSQKSFIRDLSSFNNLVVLQTLSKAWGLAALRIGAAYADREIISLLNKVKTPYNVSSVTQELATEALQNITEINKWIKQIAEQRISLSESLGKFSFVEKVYPSDANFLLIKVKDAEKIYNYLLSKKIIVRNQSSQPLLENCLRITIGTPTENDLLIEELKNYRQ